MKNLNKLIASAFLTAFLMSATSAQASHESQEVIPPAINYIAEPHEHIIGNPENADDPTLEKLKVAPNNDDHHEKKSMDDTNK